MEDIGIMIGKVNGSGYHHFIENMPDGLVYMEKVVNDIGKATDYVFLEANKSFEQLIEIKLEQVLGKRITEISSDGKIAGFDFIDICGKVDLLEEKIEFEHYSEVLNKWYLIYTYISEKDNFCVVFHDITEIKNRAVRINTLYESLAKFHETTFLDIDYQWIADELLKLSGATFVLVNVYDKDSIKTITRGFSGLNRKMRQAVRILGYDIIGKVWDVGEADLGVMKSKKLVKMGRLHEFSFNRIAPFIINTVERIIKLGDSFGIGITYNEEILGSFIIMMRQGKSIESPDIVELFVNQLGIMLLRKKAEQEIKKLTRNIRLCLMEVKMQCF